MITFRLRNRRARALGAALIATHPLHAMPVHASSTVPARPLAVKPARPPEAIRALSLADRARSISAILSRPFSAILPRPFAAILSRPFAAVLAIPLAAVQALLLAAVLAVPVAAQDLNLYITADSDVVSPGDRVVYTLTVSNTGPADLTSISTEVQRPDPLSFATVPAEGIVCFSGGNCTWTVDALGPGETRTIHLASNLPNDAQAGIITTAAVATAAGEPDAAAEVDVTIDETPLLRISTAPEFGPALPGEPLTYVVTFGNVGGGTATDVVVRMAVPDGSDFASASSGGSVSGEVVSWNVGTLGVGAGDQVRLTVTPEADLDPGSVLVAEAEIDPGDPADIVRSGAQTPVRSDAALRIRYSVSQTAVNRDERLVYSLTASNTGEAAVTDIAVRMLRPLFLSFPTMPDEGWTCFSGGGLCTWSIDALEPGETREIFFYSNVADQASYGDVLRSTLLARAGGSAQVSAAVDAQVDPTPLLRLGFAPERGPAQAGEPFTYVLTYGNVGSSTPSDVVLSMPLPAGTQLVDASDGGVVEADGVTWNIGTVGPGAGGQVRLTVRPGSDLESGTLISARAELDSGVGTEYVVRSTAVTPVGPEGPLQVAYGLSQSSFKVEDQVVYTLTASNSGTTDLTGIEIRLLGPDFLSFPTMPSEDFACFSPGITCEWTVGTLAAGESRQVVISRVVDDSAVQGEVLRSRMLARSDASPQAKAAIDAQIDPTPRVKLSLASPSSPSSSGEPATYYLSFSNVGASGSVTPSLSMSIPPGTQLESATCGAVVEDDLVTWHLDPLAPGVGGRFFATVVPDPGLAEGELLSARAELDSGTATEYVVHSAAATAVGDMPPLDVRFEASRRAAEPSDTLSYDLSVENTGPADLLDVMVILRVPPLVVFTSSDLQFSGGNMVWNVGALPPGESRITSITVTLPPATAERPRGTLMRTWISASATGSRPITLQDDVIMGARANFAPEAAAIIAPEDGAEILVGGLEPDEPVLPDSVLIVQWEAPCDPEMDALTYRWQLSASDDFSTLLVDQPSAEEGSAVHVEIEFGALAQVLTVEGVELGASRTLYHRVVASDGINETPGGYHRILLTRGQIVGTSDRPDLPAVFALHSNYPNPFNPSTTFAFDLAAPSDAELTVFDAVGRRMATIVSGRLEAGRHTYRWDAADLPSGVYFYRLRAGAYRMTRTLVLHR